MININLTKPQYLNIKQALEFYLESLAKEKIEIDEAAIADQKEMMSQTAFMNEVIALLKKLIDAKIIKCQILLDDIIAQAESD